MYISPEGRLLPCLSLSGMDIQKRFPSLTEAGLKQCLTDSYYLDFITSKAQNVLDHNPECRECPYQQWRLGGCRASGLESSAQTDLYHRDEAVCAMYFGGWAGKLIDLMETLHPEIQCAARQDTQFMKALRGT